MRLENSRRILRDLCIYDVFVFFVYFSKTSDKNKQIHVFVTKQQTRPRKSARIRVLMVGKDRADFTEKFTGIPAQIRWLELDHGRLKSEKTTNIIPGRMRDIFFGVYSIVYSLCMVLL